MVNSCSLIARLILAFLLFSFASGMALNPDFQQYHKFSELSRSLKQLVKEHPQLATMESIGKTAAGTDIWMVKIDNKHTGDELQKPGICIVANIEGNHLAGSELAIFAIDYLLSQAAESDSVARLLDKCVFYIIPRANPDAAEIMFGKVRFEQICNFTPVDDDFDGRSDEDGPEDLNGDGYITLMRVPDSSGTLIPDQTDPRLQRAADAAKGERGIFRIETEGIDNDGDGKINEDPPGGVNINRNFPEQYAEYGAAAGQYMCSEPETRALLHFIAAHKNINMMLIYGLHDNLVNSQQANANPKQMTEEEPSRGRRQSRRRQPVTTRMAKDITYFKQISEHYKKLTTIEAKSDGLKADGALHQWAYFQQGIWALAAKTWWQPEMKAEATPADSGKNKSAPEDSINNRKGKPARAKKKAEKKEIDELAAERAWLKWSDDARAGEGFSAWQPYEHPDLGRVEIGGFKPFFQTNPPADKLAELGESHARFALYLAGLLPRVKIASAGVEKKGEGIYLITAEIANTGYLPTVPEIANRTDAVSPTRVTLELMSGKIIAGEKHHFIRYIEGSGRRQKVQWLINAKKGTDLKLELVSPRAGSDVKSLKLN
ncbi:hypothetical protein JXJ21_13700 [candidate division KSB1 bacterium]|nr:hypothetical protein [candidate division KSB1 bacterium]